MKGTFGVINGYYNIVSPISSIQVNQDFAIIYCTIMS